LRLPFHLSRIHFDGHKTESVSEDFVLDDGSVVVYVDVLDRHGRHLKRV
jgi:hypothetical protein